MTEHSAGTGPKHRAAAIAGVLTEAEKTLQSTTRQVLAWFDAQQMPAMRWETGELVSATALHYLLHCQARAKTVKLNDARGERVFEYGARQFTARLGLDRTLHLSDGTGKRIAALPKPGAHDDDEKAAAAQASWKLLKTQLQPALKTQTQQ